MSMFYDIMIKIIVWCFTIFSSITFLGGIILFSLYSIEILLKLRNKDKILKAKNLAIKTYIKEEKNSILIGSILSIIYPRFKLIT